MYYAYKFGEWLANILPFRMGYGLASFFAFIYFCLCPNDRRFLEENLEVVLKEKATPRAIRKHTLRAFINFAKYLVEFFRLNKLNMEYIRRNVEIKGLENLDKAISNGKGVIILSAHIGNWELAAGIVGLLGYDISVIALTHKDKKSNGFFVSRRNKCGVKVVSMESVLKKCVNMLNENKLLAILGDRDISNSGVKYDFFNKKASMPKGPAFFALKTGASVIPAFLIRQKNNKFKYYIEPPLQYQPYENKKEFIDNIMKENIRVMEKYIKEYPDQWYVFNKIWE